MLQGSKRVIVCALARDCAWALKKNIKRIEKMRRQFLVCDVLVIENDSRDQTKQLLWDWKQKSEGVYVISNDYHTVTIPESLPNKVNPRCSYHRIEKMTRYRNIYLDWIEERGGAYDYVIVLDIDANSFTTDIAKIIDRAPADWGGITAHGIWYSPFDSIYYDTYPYMENKPEKLVFHVEKPDEYHANAKRIHKQIKRQPYMPVYSAFAGMGIYKQEAIKGLRYELMFNEMEDEEAEIHCEHVSLNKAISERGYQLYIARDLKMTINSYKGIIHVYIKSILFRSRFIKKILIKYNLAKE
ncbi:hypothetical protein LJC54_02550, partial [Parabacteroides sp. OttesenSCG-928-J18]|nr:hypothetical protein [Parabacteroides sp. OttesenSCG-928-J18]